MRKKINICSVDNGVGLTRDTKIIWDLLEPYYDLNYIEFDTPVPNAKADMNIYLEKTDVKLQHLAKLNILIPNPEWYCWHENSLKSIDYVLAKTRDCEKIFSRYNKVIFTSFTSKDMYQEREKQRMYFHCAGQSQTKNSDDIFETWTRYNDLPKLFFCRTKYYEKHLASPTNLVKCFFRFSDDELKAMLNTCMFHLCTSQYEGWGHYLWEAKSTGAIIITSDHPPMNEFITEKNGFLVKPNFTKRMNMAEICNINMKHLYETVKLTELLSEKELKVLSKNSRSSWEDNDRFFKKTFVETIKNIC